MTTVRRWMTTEAPGATLLIRLVVGWVFFSEGLQKFLEPAARGTGRFAKMGLPAPDLLAPLVGSFEITCGALVLLGLFTRLAALPLIAIMLTALVTTKLPILLGHAFWGLSLRELPSYGLWSAAHASRTDLAMLFSALFLLCVGAGRWSLDALWSRAR